MIAVFMVYVVLELSGIVIRKGRLYPSFRMILRLIAVFILLFNH